MDTYQAMSMTELAALVGNEKKETPSAKQIYHARRERLKKISQIIAYLAQEEPMIIGFPRHPEFYSIFTCQGEPKPPDVLLDPEQQYKDFFSICYLQTAVEVYSREDAKALLRPHFHELTVNPTLVDQVNDQGNIQYGLWSFSSSVISDYIQACDALMRDDYFTVLQGDATRLQELLEA